MPPSIADVARLANVSISTVSRCLNRRELVNEQTRQRVESAIKELGYRPNAFARGLMLRRSEVVGLVLPDLHGEFYSEIIRGANLKARELDYSLMLASAHGLEDSDALADLIGKRVFLDGVALMVSEVNDALRELTAALRVPLVLVDADVNGAPHDCVVIDQRAGALALMKHVLTTCGARRVVFVGGLETNVDTRARFQACRDALQEHGLTLAQRDVFYLDYDYDTAYRLAGLHVRDWAGPDCCVFAANDEMASGIIAAATEAGVSVPQDLAVVGFDDTRVARMTRPALTTVRVPMSEMGAAAIDLLCRRIADREQPATRISLQPALVVRDSCGARLKGRG